MIIFDLIAVRVVENTELFKRKPFFAFFCMVLAVGIGAWFMSFVGGRDITIQRVFALMFMGSIFVVLLSLTCRWWCSFRSLSGEVNKKKE